MVDEVVEVRTERVSYSIRVIEETDGDRRVPFSAANDCSSVGDGSNSIVDRFRHPSADWESTGDGEEESDEVTGFERSHEEDSTALGAAATVEESNQFSISRNQTQSQTLEINNRFAAFTLLEEQEKDYDAGSERRRQVSMFH
jgi:hypothetical protein